MANRTYYTLVTLIKGKWYEQFGDYDKEVVIQEQEDTYDEDPYFEKCKIIKHKEGMEGLNAALALLNK